jgi:transcription antitermination factor NusG
MNRLSGNGLLSQPGDAMRKFTVEEFGLEAYGDGAATADTVVDRHWYAVFTVPQNEKSAARHLSLRDVESFVPTYQSTRVWKNRQRVQLALPLFPSYLFARIGSRERRKVLGAPGVLRIVGNTREPLPVPDATIEFLRSDLCVNRIEPYRELVVGQKVRIRRGAMCGLQGVLVRKNNNLRFVLTVDLINQHAAVEIGAENLEPVTG